MRPHGKRLERFWAGGFLYDPKTDRVFLHQRDGLTKINPNKWAFFGGLNEGPETFSECFVRELKEEIGIEVSDDEVLFLREYENTELNTYRVVFYVISSVSESDLTLGEGAGFGWISLLRLQEYDLTEKTREDLIYFSQTIR